MKTITNYFLLDIMAKKGSPLIFISNVPPLVHKNLVIEYFTVKLAHWFIMMDFLPPFWSLFSIMVLFTINLIFSRVQMSRPYWLNVTLWMGILKAAYFFVGDWVFLVLFQSASAYCCIRIRGYHWDKCSLLVCCW